MQAAIRATSQAVPPTPVPPTMAPAPAPTAAPTAAPQPLSEADVVSKARPWLAHIARGSATGSGIMASPDGDIVTNEHVVRGGGPYRVTLSDGRVLYADLMAQDAAADLALLRVGAATPDYARWADTGRLRRASRWWWSASP